MLYLQLLLLYLQDFFLDHAIVLVLILESRCAHDHRRLILYGFYIFRVDLINRERELRRSLVLDHQLLLDIYQLLGDLVHILWSLVGFHNFASPRSC